MRELDLLIDVFLENLKKLLYPEQWIQFDLKFSKSEIFAMLLIHKKGEITMTELAEYLNSPMSTANGIIERLVKKGYVIRDRSDFDRRIVVLSLTEAGSDLINGFKELVSKYLDIILEELSDEEKQFMIRIIFKVIQSAQNKFDRSSKPEEKKVKNIEIE